MEFFFIIGMDGVDKEKVQRIVYEMSKGSKYFENEQRKEALVKQKIENMCAKVKKLTEEDISHFQMIAVKRILELEASRDLSKIWMHIDMDAFYAAVETLENPSLRGKPMAVGSLSMISTANYEARKFGVRAAMPGFIARKLCPDLIIVPTNFEKYAFYSDLTRKVFRRYDSDFIATSLDEAYINITEVCVKKGVGSDEVAAELRKAVFEETGLTCSAGVAANHLLAKVCSDVNKPNGQFVLPNNEKAIMTFVSSLPIRKIGGIGKVTEHILRDVLQINTCEEMLQKSALLCALFSRCSSDFFFSVGLGLGRTDTPEQNSRKSISSERTFRATEDESFLFQKLGDIAETLSNDMQKENLSGRTLTLKLKTASFEVRTRAISLQNFIHSKEDILTYASCILKEELPLSLRLIGLRMSQFHDDNNGPVNSTQKTITDFLGLCEGASPSAAWPKRQDCTSFGDKLEKHDGFHFSDKPNMPDLNVGYSSIDDKTAANDDDNHFFSYESHHSDCSRTAEGINRLNDSSLQLMLFKTVEGNQSANSNEPQYMASQKQGLIWVDDYICSDCGIELPPSYIEERQEHSDYHLALMLQEEESTNNRVHQAQSSVDGAIRVELGTSQGREDTRKRRKTSKKEAKHIPIESFFSKCKQS
ncbi:DNA repair protein REV1 [Apostasia shenzhenica]|uniref:DNA polymerase kappa n=1 Tax=Apostasia shenzhenica TaxID=1088818 RepID=A0A2I0AFJ5_9ASPA|nr:DNA repair protein REV1 [Apostasia shenzhenica]